MPFCCSLSVKEEGMRISKWYLLILLTGLISVSCSRQKDNFFSRTYHRMTAKFNPLFNGEQAFLQGYNSLVAGHQNNYDEVIALYPFGSEEQAQSVVPQMDRAIEKSVKVIKEHSMNIAGNEKNPYVIDAYMLLAKASFFKHDYFKAVEGFNYVIQHFPNTEQAIEARLWAGRTSTRLENEFSARAQFEEIYRNRDVRNRLKPHIYASMAELEISLGNWTAASDLLKEALDEGPEKVYRMRWRYALGQVYERMMLRHEASEAFSEVVSDHPADYELYLNAQLQRALNFDVTMGRVREVYEDLEDMAKDDKNTEFRDRIFYVMGLLALEDEDYAKADESLKRSVRASTGNNEQKGLSYLKLAEIEFEFRQYVTSQAYYDSAFSTLPRTHRRFEDVERFRGSLNDLVEQITTIETNDSLIRLAGMSPSQQRAVFENYIAALKEQEEQEAEEARIRELNRSLAADADALGSGPQAGLAGGTWYFYNETTRSSGLQEFRNLWGRRELSDNWRRSAAANAAVVVPSGETPEEKGEEEGGERSEGPVGQERYNIEAYLAQIPKSDEVISGMHEENQDAYVRMASIYKEALEDNQEALKAYQKLLERYPDSKHSDMALYALYLLYKELGDETKAEEYATQLRNRYPSSRFTAQMEGRLEESNARMIEANQAYRTVYEMYSSGNASGAKAGVKQGSVKYADLPVAAKFNLLYALVLAKTDGVQAYADQLRAVVEGYPGSVEAEKANALLMYVDEASSGEVDLSNSPYYFEPKMPHRVIIVVPNGRGDINELRNKISDYNTEFHRFQNIQVQSIFLDRERQLIVISGFKEFSESEQYADRVVRNPKVLPVFSSDFMRIFAISDANYQTFYRLKDVDEYMTFHDQISQ